MLYNVPGRTVTDIQPRHGRAARRRRFPTCSSAIKDASGELAARVGAPRGGGRGFRQLSGNDDLALAFNAMGGVGCISVTANVAPRLCADFQAACAAGDYAAALALHDRLYPLHAAMFTDASPGPVKYALSQVRPGFPAELAPADDAAVPTREPRVRSMRRWHTPELTRQPTRLRTGRRTRVRFTSPSPYIAAPWPAPNPPTFEKTKIVAENRRARFEYSIDTVYEAGIALTGTEVKSLRFGEGSIAESYAEVKDEQVWLVNANIPEFSHGNRFNHEPKRPRKLLLHEREINKLHGAVARAGHDARAAVGLFQLAGAGEGRTGAGQGQEGP